MKKIKIIVAIIMIMLVVLRPFKSSAQSISLSQWINYYSNLHVSSLPVLVDSIVGGQNTMYLHGNIVDSLYTTDTLWTKIIWGYAPYQVFGYDSIFHPHNFGTFMDSLGANPGSNYIVNLVYKDTSGIEDTLWVNLPVVVHQTYTMPSLSVNNLNVSFAGYKPVISITYNSGYTNAVISRVWSPGDTVLSSQFQLNPSINLSGQGVYNDTLPTLPQSSLFSLRYTITNIIGDTTSAIVYGQVPGAPMLPSINNFSSITTTTDSAYLTTLGSTGNLQTKFAINLYDSTGTTLLQTDTITMSAQTGQVNLQFSFGGLTPNSYYQADACAISSLGIMCQSNKSTVHTQAIAPVFSFMNLTQQTAGASSSLMKADVVLPTSGNHLVNFIWTDSTDVNYMSATAVAVNCTSSSGIFPLQTTITGQIVGHTYRASWYGNDGSTFLSPHDFEIFWTFQGTVGLEEHDFSELDITSCKITNLQGQIVYDVITKSEPLSTNFNLPTGIYVLSYFDKYGNPIKRIKKFIQ